MLEASDVIELFFKHLPVKKINQGEIIFQTGDKGHAMYALISGEVELRRNDEIVEVISEHDVFGEGALVQPTHDRFTTAVAKIDCEIATLDKEKFLFLVQETPLFAIEIIRSLSTRLRKLKNKSKNPYNLMKVHE